MKVETKISVHVSSLQSSSPPPGGAVESAYVNTGFHPRRQNLCCYSVSAAWNIPPWFWKLNPESVIKAPIASEVNRCLSEEHFNVASLLSFNERRKQIFSLSFGGLGIYFPAGCGRGCRGATWSKIKITATLLKRLFFHTGETCPELVGSLKCKLGNFVCCLWSECLG